MGRAHTLSHSTHSPTHYHPAQDTIKRICVSAVPEWSSASLAANADLEVTHIKSHNNNIFRVGLVQNQVALFE